MESEEAERAREKKGLRRLVVAEAGRTRHAQCCCVLVEHAPAAPVTASR